MIFGRKLAAGTALATEQPDGTVVVRDVPIFSEIRPTDPGVVEGMRTPRDRAWLETAVGKTRARIALGKRPIMTRKHIFDGPERAGGYEPERVELADVNPDEAPRWTVFGTKIYESRDAFEKSKDYDFRSIEISPDAPDEFGALALLRDKEPFHKYPSLRERLGSVPGATEAFQVEAFRALTDPQPQLWRGRVEAFESKTATKTATSTKTETATHAYTKGNVTVTGGAGDGDTHVTIGAPPADADPNETKEGSMPADTKTEEKKSPSGEEALEAMASKIFAAVSKKLDAYLATMKGDADTAESDKKNEDRKDSESDTAKESTAKAGGTEEPKEKKPGSGSAEAAPEKKKGPDADPAVSQAAAGETFAAQAARAGAALLSKDEKFELLGLRSWAKAKQADEQVETFALAGEKALESAGVPIDAEIRSELRGSAKDFGKAGVERAVQIMTRFAKNAARAPEAYGALAGVNGVNGGPHLSAFDADVKKAVETFGARPETKARIMDLAAQFRQEGETFMRSLEPGAFFKTAAGTASINPRSMEAFGGLPMPGRGN